MGLSRAHRGKLELIRGNKEFHDTMSIIVLVIAVINAVAALWAHAVASRKGRNADHWTLATALFSPAILALLALPHRNTEAVDVATVESAA